MAEYRATIVWERNRAAFVDNRYSRGHVWRFDGGVEVPGSSSPHVVRVPFSVEAAVDPEEALVAALSSCHMLSFLYISAKKGFVVDEYRDEAIGVMGKNERGKLWVTRVTLRPEVKFGVSPSAQDGVGKARTPTREELETMHHEAHEECFIANSVKTEVRCEPR